MKNLDKVLFCIAILFAVIYTYWNLPSTFFQQDEWLGLGNYLYFEKGGGSFLKTSSFHSVPLTIASSYLQFKIFGLNFFYYAIVSIIGHLINAFLVFYLALILLKNKYLAFYSGLFFAVSSIGSQAVFWIAASISTQTATSFFLLSLIFLSKYLLNQKKNVLILGLSFFSLFIGLFFKEIVLSLFIIIPLFWFILFPKINKGFLKKILIPLFIIALIYFSIKITFAPVVTNNNSIVKPWVIPHMSTYTYRAITSPFKIIPQSILPAKIETDISKKIVYLAYPQYFAFSEIETNPYVVETVIFDMVSYILSLFIICFLYLIYRHFSKNKNHELTKSLLITIIIIVGSAFPFIFIPGVAGYFSIYEPRHLYIAVSGSSILLTILIFGILRMISYKEKYATYLSVIIILPLLWFNMQSVRGEINNFVENGRIRKMILNTISKNYKNLPEKIIFYTESDRAYYGMTKDDRILPFQSGFGQTLLVWYEMRGENIPSCFFANDFLYEMGKEGYKECDARGFGYFRKFESLKKTLSENNLSEKNVVAFSWNSKNKIFTEITPKIRENLKQDSFK